MLKRLQTDFQLGIVLLFGFCSSLIIAPFAIYRFVTGSVAVGILDSALVFIIAGVVYYGWKFGKTERTGKFLVIISGIGALLSSEMLGVVGLFWMYVAIVANFFLTTNLRFATVFTVSILILLAVTGHSFENAAQMWSFLATGSLLSLLSYIIAHQYSIQHGRLKHLATVDPLTGAYNRRHMEQEMHQAVEEFARHSTPMALILMDIDRFKEINDRFGHEAGDEVLTRFAGLVHGHTRQIDRFYRFGGEEFLLLIKGVGLEEAMQVAEKIRSGTEKGLVGSHGQVTISAGVAHVREGESCMQWVGRADAALYGAKEAGRNRVHVSD